MGLTGLENRLLACFSKSTVRTRLRHLGKRAQREAFLIDVHVVENRQASVAVLIDSRSQAGARRQYRYSHEICDTLCWTWKMTSL